MLEKTKDGSKKAKTSHTLNPVPFIVYDPKEKRELNDGSFGLANVAASVCRLLDVQAPEQWEKGIVK